MTLLNTDLNLRTPCLFLTSKPFKPLLLAFFADNEEQRNAQSDQDDGGADGEELFHVVTFSAS